MIQLGMGVLGWTPDAFWRASLAELFAAIDGWSEAHGSSGIKPEAPSLEEIRAAMAREGM